MAEINGTSASRRWFALVAGEPVLSILVAALVALQIAWPQPAVALVRFVDWQTVATLAGLLMVTKALEMSGFLMWLAHRIVHRVRTERSLAMLLIVFAAVLATWLTNDVALFVAVPLVVSLQKLAPLPFKRLVICLAIAVNAGSIATPLGNPQNLFLWQRSGISLGRFIVELGPLALMTMLMLLVLAAGLFRPTALDFSGDTEPHPVHRPLAIAAALLFAGFVAAADAHHAVPGMIAIAAILGMFRRAVVLRIDWLLLLIFVLMFVVLRSAAALPVIHDTLARLGLDAPLRLLHGGRGAVARHQQRAGGDPAFGVRRRLARARVRRERRRLRFRDRLVREPDRDTARENTRHLAAVSPRLRAVRRRRVRDRRGMAALFLARAAHSGALAPVSKCGWKAMQKQTLQCLSDIGFSRDFV